MRPALLADYAALGGGLPEATTRLALSAWLVPSALMAGIALSASGASPWVRKKTGLLLLGTGLVVTAFVLGFAMWAAYSPAFSG